MDFENKRYTFKEQDKQDITEIVKGETVITYVYKQKYENNLPPVETETKIPIETTYQEDPTKDVGDNETIDNGSEGKIVTTTPKIVNELDGTVTDGKPTEVRTEMKPKVVKVGTKPKDVETPIPFTIRYEKDEEKPNGEKTEVTQGVNGKTITTTTYTMNPKTGELTPNDPTSVTENPVTKVVKVGAKPKVETNVIPIETTVIEDPTRDFGSSDIVENDGREGKVTITTPYHVNEQTGDVTEGESVEERLDMVRRVVRVGIKRSSIPNDAPKVEENFFTGHVVPNDAPVLEVPEYGGPIGMNGEPEVLEKPLFTGSVVPNDSPVLEVPEYGGPIGMNGEPEVLEKPLFTGSVVPNDSPVLEVPEYGGPIGMNGEPEILEKPIFTGHVVPNDAPILEVPEYGGPIGMNGETEKREEDIVSNSLEKIVPQEYVGEQKQLDEKISQMNESNVLPNTGSQETNVLAIFGGSLMVLVFGFLFKNRKND